MTIVGQTNLLNKLQTYNLDNFPHSVILQGETGSGKHTICSYIADNILSVPYLDITDKLSADTIDTIYRNSKPGLYIINVDSLTEKEQNAMLKFIEEPLKTIFIILLCENSNSLLTTVLNRCVLFNIELYSREEITQFLSEDLKNIDNIFDIVRTPGKAKNLNVDTLSGLFELCDKIVNKIEFASYLNTLSISDKINYKDNYDKFDMDLFFDTLCFKLKDKFIVSNSKKHLDMYLLTIEFKKRLLDKRINKEIFMQNYLTNLWKLCKKSGSL